MKEEEQLDFFSLKNEESKIKEDALKEEIDSVEHNDIDNPFSLDNINNEFSMAGQKATLIPVDDLIAQGDEIYSSIGIYQQYNENFQRNENLLVVFYDDENKLKIKEITNKIQENYDLDNTVFTQLMLKEDLEPLGNKRIETSVELLKNKIKKLKPESNNLDIEEEMNDIKDRLENGIEDDDDLEEKPKSTNKSRP